MMSTSNSVEPDRIISTLECLLGQHGFAQLRLIHPGEATMGAWLVDYQSDEFIVSAGQERSGEVPDVSVGSRFRRKPRAHMRGPWSLGHLRGFFEGRPDHYLFCSAEEQLDWLEKHLDVLLDSTLLNSDDLNAWAVEASRRLGSHPTTTLQSAF